jgi:chromosome segregation ATPase
MVEQIMYFGIGFLLAAFFALLFFPLVHNRAVRLTIRRLEAATPLTISEIRADKDQLRAEFAMSTRRLEMSVEEMKAKTTTQLAELGKKKDSINQLKKELGEKTAAIFAMESRDKEVLERARAAEAEFELKSSALREAERILADKEAELEKLTAELGEQAISGDGQRLEVAALRAQLEAMKVTATDSEHLLKQTDERLNRERIETEAAVADLNDARKQLDRISARCAELERQLVTQTAEADLLNARIRELEGRLTTQGRTIAERDYEIERLNGEVDAARKIERDLRVELTKTGGRTNDVAAKYKTDISQLEAQLEASRDERTKLEADIEALHREAESSWAAERVENALLRERINDVAAEVARLTATLEGPNSPIDTLLAAETPSFRHAMSQTNGNPGVNGTRGEAGPAGLETEPERKSTLADRIRALQSTASRVARSN